MRGVADEIAIAILYAIAITIAWICYHFFYAFASVFEKREDANDFLLF